MRLLSVLSLGLGGLSLAGAAKSKKTAEERFQLYHGKALSSAPVKLADPSFRELTTAPRDYAAAVLLTAMDPRYGCQMCREFQPEWELLARSWTGGDRKGDSRLVFGTLDFGDGKDTFISLGLRTVPVLILYPPTTGPHAAASADPIRYDFTSGSHAAEAVHQWLSRHLPDRPHPPVKRPINWVRWIATFILVSGALTVSYVAWPYVLPIIQSRTVWAAVTLISILLFTSGHMFNHIRNVPYVSGDGRGGINYIATDGILTLSGISLAVKVPRIGDPRYQGIVFVVWFSVMALMYSLLLSVFRRKNSAYTFSLPPFM
ncbi:hypothetical protein VTH06DRAFT_7357 [Thermothelomyces fergusii]